MNRGCFILIFFLFTGFTSFAQTRTSKCNLEVRPGRPQVLLDKVRWYTMEVYNGSQRTLDALEWDAYFYNRFNDLVGVRKGTWSSGKWIDPVQPGKTLTEVESPDDIGDADRVEIYIKKAHFVGGYTCN